MKCINWNSEKSKILKIKRGISFEEIAYLIESGQIIGVEENPGRPDQKMYVLEIENYAVLVPFVESEEEIFLKTAFPSRKYTKLYGLRRNDEKRG
ncbi:MAG: toxin [Candidatus Sabulitectum sp.]|nr:toxin [Candidatus Sabulitectum sp.]